MKTDSLPETRTRPSLRGRASALLAAVAVNLLLLSALLMLNVSVETRPRLGGRPVLVDLIPDDEQTESDSSSAEQESNPAEMTAPDRAPAQAAREPAATPPPPVEAQPLPDTRPLPFTVLSKADMAASDIGKMERSAPPAQAGAGAVHASRDSERVGTAPNGEPLYRAEWHRRPTHAELAAYLPERMPAEGWGLIACRTAPRFKVEDCVEIADSPPGSRLAGAVRQAAWQFLVRPPRIGGKPLVGSWVSIRIEYSPRAAE